MPYPKPIRVLLTLAAGAALVVVASTAIPHGPAEIDVVPGLIGLPQVYHRNDRGWEGWCFTGPAKEDDVVERLKSTLLPRGWTYGRTRYGEDAFSYSPPQPLGGLLEIFPHGNRIARERSRIGFVVMSGRIMPTPPTEPFQGDWTTVKMDSTHAWNYSGPGPYPFWPVVKNEEENALANVPRGEERNLGTIIGLPLIVHKSKFGTPYWVFSGPESRKTVEATVTRALTGRPGWRAVPGGGIRDGEAYDEMDWAYRSDEPFAEDHRPTRDLLLRFYDGQASGISLTPSLARPWTTVTVVAQGGGAIDDPAGIEHAHR